MYFTVKLLDRGKTLDFKGQQIRLPATIDKLSKKDLTLLKVMCTAQGVTYEILEQESERLVSMIEKAREPTNEVPEPMEEDGEIIVENLFESEDTMAELLKNLNKDE